MVFWIFMFLMALIIPFTMIGFGRAFLRKAPESINYFFGYRTKRSMQSEQTWQFAHQYCGKIWHVSGWILLVLSVVPLLVVVGKDAGIVGTVGGILSAIQCICLAGAILPTERALRNNFDQDGNLK